MESESVLLHHATQRNGPRWIVTGGPACIRSAQHVAEAIVDIVWGYLLVSTNNSLA